MPEGPEVRLVAEALAKIINGMYLRNVEVDESYYRKCPEWKTHVFEPSWIRHVKSYGKKILIILTNGTLINGLGMTGMWSTTKKDHCRVILHYDGGIVYFHDPRPFGSFHFVKGAVHHPEDLGLDLLSDPPSKDEWMMKWINKKKKCPNQSVSVLLLNQEFYSGIGNYLKSEILYNSGILPNRVLGSLSEDDIEKLYDSSVSIIMISYLNGGASISTFYHMDGQKGEFGHFMKVYRKEKCPNGHTITKEITKDQRSSFWCAICQV